MIVPYRDGPYLVRGPVNVRDQDGRPIAIARRTIALCRCGKSRTRPFCDGTHRLVKFCAPSHAERPRLASEGHERDDRITAPRDETERGRHAIAMVQLVRVSAKADSLLATGAPSDIHAAVRAAVPLIAAARLLLAQFTPEPDPAAQTPCLCLIREALAALSSAEHTSDWGVGDLIALLTSVARTLERNGS